MIRGPQWPVGLETRAARRDQGDQDGDQQDSRG